MSKKNYLFKPFDNDEDKINAFNYLDKNLDHSELVLFIGSLESYYDVIISELKAEVKEHEKQYDMLASSRNNK